MTCAGRLAEEERKKRKGLDTMVSVSPCTRQYRLMHRRDSGVPRGVCLCHAAEKCHGIKAARTPDRGTNRERGRHSSDEAVNVKQWHHIHTPIPRVRSREAAI